MAEKPAQALWQDYRFLTKEIKKFLKKQDMALFYHLVEQRELVQTIIDQTTDDGFKDSQAGRTMLTEIQQENQEIIHDLQVQLGRSKRQHQVSEAYSGVSNAPISRLSWKR
ncbi:MAG: hypothetical protein P4L59_20935 [Desulfosporosinus sp.]|nr:hypothetical protein [Desulfosporosinus sp.]